MIVFAIAVTILLSGYLTYFLARYWREREEIAKVLGVSVETACAIPVFLILVMTGSIFVFIAFPLWGLLFTALAVLVGMMAGAVYVFTGRF